jgi:nucleoside-diphosphate-sugar epimerase
MKIGIVGGTGNISTSIVARLLEGGHEVVGVNRGQSAEPPAGVRTVVVDRHDRPRFETLMQAERFDAAIDMICFDKDDAESDIRAFGAVSHFVYCSTVCTYGVEFDYMPVDERHPRRPTTGYGRGKVAADSTFLAAHYGAAFPVTIIKPSITYGPKMGLLRQIAWDFSWIDRVRKGKPIAICGDGLAAHQFLHVDDAALAFAGVIGKQHMIGNTYNMTRRGFTTWVDYHRTAMRVIGRDVELVGVPLADLVARNVPNVGICAEIFAFNGYYNSEALYHDVPEFAPRVSLEAGMARVINALDSDGRIPDSDEIQWEDDLIAAQRRMREL